MDRLAGKTAVITGIGPGIGSAIARAFAREGADLILAGFANPAFEKTAADLRTSGRLLAALHGDVGRRTVWDEIAAVADRERVHIVVNSAATGRFAPILDVPEEEWDETMRTNLPKHGDYIDVEDTASAVVEFENGALASIVATTTLRSVETAPGFRLAVHGAEGVTVGLSERPELTQAITDQWPFESEETVRAWAAAEGGKPGFPGFHSDQLRDFARAVLEDREPTVTAADAVRALEVIKAVYLSEARRSRVVLPMSAEDRAEADRITTGA